MHPTTRPDLYRHGSFHEHGRRRRPAADATLINGTGTFAVTLATEGTQAITRPTRLRARSPAVRLGSPSLARPRSSRHLRRVDPGDGSTSLELYIQNNNTTTRSPVSPSRTPCRPGSCIRHNRTPSPAPAGGGNDHAHPGYQCGQPCGRQPRPERSCVFSVNVTGHATARRSTPPATSPRPRAGPRARRRQASQSTRPTRRSPSRCSPGSGSTKRPPFPAATVDSPSPVTDSTASTACSVTSGGVITLLQPVTARIDARPGRQRDIQLGGPGEPHVRHCKGNQTITFGALADKTLAQRR